MFECTLVSQIPIAFIHETCFSSKSSICKSFLSSRSSRAPFGQASRVPSPKTTVAMAASAALRRMMAQDPVLTACAVLSAIGLGAPLIVPPIRNAMNRPEPITPPKLANVVEGMTGKARN